jgi:hypothetical protein
MIVERLELALYLVLCTFCLCWIIFLALRVLQKQRTRTKYKVKAEFQLVDVLRFRSVTRFRSPDSEFPIKIKILEKMAATLIPNG